MMPCATRAGIENLNNHDDPALPGGVYLPPLPAPRPPHQTNLDRRVQVYMHRRYTPTHQDGNSLAVFAHKSEIYSGSGILLNCRIADVCNGLFVLVLTLRAPKEKSRFAQSTIGDSQNAPDMIPGISLGRPTPAPDIGRNRAARDGARAVPALLEVI